MRSECTVYFFLPKPLIPSQPTYTDTLCHFRPKTKSEKKENKLRQKRLAECWPKQDGDKKGEFLVPREKVREKIKKLPII